MEEDQTDKVKVVEMAMKKSTIAVVEREEDTIFLMLVMIRKIGKCLNDKGDRKKLISVLAPTVHRVHQHHKEIKMHTDLNVEEYYGAKGVDDWNSVTWEKEINDHDVLVMTPQVLLGALRNGYIKLDVFCFIILDECQLATGNHPLMKIVKDFYLETSEKPNVFGVTTSPITTEVFSSIKSKKQIDDLQSLLDSQVCIVEPRTEHEAYASLQKSICRFYDPIRFSNLELKEKLEFSWSKLEANLDVQKLMPTRSECVEKTFKLLLNVFSNNYAEIVFCLKNLGLICASEAGKFFLESVPRIEEDFLLTKESIQHYENFIRENQAVFNPEQAAKLFMESSNMVQEERTLVKERVQQHKMFLHETMAVIGGAYEHMNLLDLDRQDAVATGQISPKLKTLIQILRSFRTNREGKSALCIIFVERIIAAKVIDRVMKQITGMCDLSVSYFLESDDDGNMHKVVMDSFRKEKEGIHLAGCSHVIRFDLPKSVYSYAQSWQHACQKKCDHIIMLERGNTWQIDHMWHIIQSNNSAKHMNHNGDTNGNVVKMCSQNEPDEYNVVAMEASINANSNVSLVQGFCQNIPGYKTMDDLEENRSEVCKDLGDLDASVELQEKVVLNSQELPSIEECSQDCSEPFEQQLASGAGTTKRKELHGSVSVSALRGTWGQELGGCYFYAYKMDFSCSIPTQKYSSFVLLLETKLEDDVGNFELELFLVTKFVRCSVSLSGQMYLDADKVAKGKCFQELIFNGLYGKLFVKASGVRTFLLQTEDSLWTSSNMYFLLPLETENSSSEGTLKINWTGIDSCVSTVEFLKTKPLLNRCQHKVSGENSRTVNDPGAVENDSDIMHLANKSASLNSLKEVVVIAVHTGRIYSVLDVMSNSSARSPFEDKTNSKYSSFSDYFLKKYGIQLKHPQQPLLLLKQGHNSHNLLVDSRNEGGKMSVVKKPQQYARLPPELLVATDVYTDVLKPFYLFPSVMHRLESFLLASQLREEISDHVGKLKISTSLILEALTTVRCNDMFSMERLELLGDSVLKYAVSCHLFLKHPKKHEGQLSSLRLGVITNSHLHKLGIGRKLQMYIRDCPFEPRRWTAPGQRSIWSSPCQHGIDSTQVLESKIFSEDKNLVIGKTCDEGHRWMGSKTISDCVEAMIGAYYISDGLPAAIDLMKWLGIEAEVEPSLMDDAFKVASLHSYSSNAEDISALESKLGYKFSNKGLLLEAITHQSRNVGYSYQRLEFLGDALLDLLIAQYLYENHRSIDPGELTELRSASVSNNNFALAAVKSRLYPHLQHGSAVLDGQIYEFVKYVHAMSTPVLKPNTIAPKALGDLVESIAGAVLIDSNLNLGEVWTVFEPLLSPIVTPEKLELPPSRALTNLCQNLGYFTKENFTNNGDAIQLELKLQLEDVMLTSTGMGSTKKAAKGMAAIQMLKKLETKGISSQKKTEECVDDAVVRPDNPKKRKLIICETPETKGISSHKKTEECVDGVVVMADNPKKQKLIICATPDAEVSSVSNKINIPVLQPINTGKGGPRTALFGLCKKQQWPLPTFNTTQENSRTPVQFGDIVGFFIFESEISLTIPNFGKIQLTGEARGDKKSSLDSAALLLLHELHNMGKIVIQGQ